MGMDCSPQDFKKRAKSEKWLRNCRSNQAASLLDQNNSTSGRQLPRRSIGLPWDRDTSQSLYYSEDSNSGESYEAQPDNMSIYTGDIEIAVRVARASEAFSGRCFRCNKVGHHFHDEECEMYDPDF